MDDEAKNYSDQKGLQKKTPKEDSSCNRPITYLPMI